MFVYVNVTEATMKRTYRYAINGKKMIELALFGVYYHVNKNVILRRAAGAGNWFWRLRISNDKTMYTFP